MPGARPEPRRIRPSEGRGQEPTPDGARRDQLHRVALEWPTYGYRRITAAVRRGGGVVNRQHVLRLRRADHLLCLRKRGVVRTTDAEHGLFVSPTVVPELAVRGPDQRWVSAMTPIRLQHECSSRAVLLAAWSRRCIGWALDRHWIFATGGV